MRLRLALPAGLLDTGAASLATFIVQAYAVRTLDLETLGVYAVFFSAYLFASQATQFLFLYPLEIAVLKLPRSTRFELLRRSIRLATPAPILGGLGVLAAILLSGSSATSLRLGFAITVGAAAITSPVYEHFKRMLHLSDRSWQAAGVAQSQLLALVVVVAVMVVSGVPPAWVPFGALAASHGVALGAGFATIRFGEMPPLRTSFMDLLRSGRWLLVSGLMPPLATLIAAGVITRLAGATELGLAQAAHVASRPILILATGLSAVLGYRLMESGSTRRRSDGNRYWRLYAALILLGGGAYMLVVGVDWPGNPMAALLPRAYEVGGLVLVTLAANFVSALLRPVRNELIGAHWEARVALVDTSAAAALIAVAAFAGYLGAFAVPLGVLAGALVHAAGYLPARITMYATSAPRLEGATPAGEG
ncbi:MAG: hypothetical protein HKN74_02630 [Acidimicrobiia bacterium]|nr:hypothetical protein [Acidimicrobiia bacterium]NNF09159.1 hypothetical protein [Acidimicrobiia bacterium]